MEGTEGLTGRSVATSANPGAQQGRHEPGWLLHCRLHLRQNDEATGFESTLLQVSPTLRFCCLTFFQSQLFFPIQSPTDHRHLPPDAPCPLRRVLQSHHVRASARNAARDSGQTRTGGSRADGEGTTCSHQVSQFWVTHVQKKTLIISWRFCRACMNIHGSSRQPLRAPDPTNRSRRFGGSSTSRTTTTSDE